MARVVGSSCASCAERWKQAPPCFELEKVKLKAIRWGGSMPSIGASCPFVVSIQSVKHWCDPRNAIPSPATDSAKMVLKYLRSLDDSKRRYYLTDAPTDSVGNSDSFVHDGEKRVWKLLYRRPEDGHLLATVKKLVGKGPLDAGQREIIERSSKIPVRVGSSGKAPTAQKASGTFVPHAALTLDNCGVDFEGLAQASNLWQASMYGGYHDNLKLLKMLQGGLSRIETAVKGGCSEQYLKPALTSLMPNDITGVQLALALASGLALQIGMMAGAAAIGAVGGAAIGTFFAPGLGTAAGAAAGVSLATLVLNYLLTANDLKDVGSQMAEQAKNAEKATKLAIENKMEEAKKAFAAIFAAILAVVLLAILARFLERGWAGVQKIRNKHKQKLEAFTQAHAEKKGATPAKVHGPPGRFGYFRENLLRPLTSGKEVHLRDSEYQTFLEIAKDHCLVIRVGDKERVTHLDSGMWARGKPSWLGQKSGVASEIIADGKHAFKGMLAFRHSEVADGLRRAVSKKGKELEFDMAMLGDAYKGMGKRPVFEIPARDLMGENFKRPGEKLKILDYKKYKTDREKCYLVKVSEEHYIIVDALGQPFIQDVDIALLQAKRQNGQGWEELGTGQRGMLGNSGKPGPDSMQSEDAINRRIQTLENKRGKVSLYDLAQHGGNGASPLLKNKEGRVVWSPLSADGKWDQEELAIFLPTPHGPRAFTFKGWEEFGAFCDANGLPFPYDKAATRKQYK